MAPFVVNTGETGTEHDGFQVFTASVFRGLRSEETGAVKMRSENNSGTAPHLQTAAPTRILQAGGSRINFAAPASEKLSPTTAVYPGGTAPHTVAAKSPAQSR